VAPPDKNQLRCQICDKFKSPNEVLPAELVRPYVVQTIKKIHTNWDDKGFICFDDLNECRTAHVQEVLRTERGELSRLEKKVVTSIQAHHLLSENLNKEFDQKLTFGEKLADKIAELGGSWVFILSFGAFLVFWIFLNGYLLVTNAYDPFPFILLNLILSCLAAVQAPFIMMSQNRQASKDRLRSESEYRINLKAELEIRHLKAKLDQLISHQWRRLLEIQQVQLELLQESVSGKEAPKK